MEKADKFLQLNKDMTAKMETDTSALLELMAHMVAVMEAQAKNRLGFNLINMLFIYYLIVNANKQMFIYFTTFSTFPFRTSRIIEYQTGYVLCKQTSFGTTHTGTTS